MVEFILFKYEEMILMKKFNTDVYLNYVYFYLFVTPWHFFNSQPFILTSILFIWTIVKFKKEWFYKLKDRINFIPLILFILFILYVYMSIFWSDSILIGLEHVNDHFKYYFLIIPILMLSLDKEKAILGLKIITISFGVYSLYSILIYLGIISIDGASMTNPKGHLRYSIGTQYMVIAFFSSIFFIYFSKTKEEKILFTIVTFLSFFALFINNSRTSQITFILILLIFIYLFFGRSIIKNLKYFVLILFIISVSIYTLFENGKLDRFKSAYIDVVTVLETGGYKGSFGTRLFFNKTGIEIFLDNMLFGTGPKDNRLLLQEIQKNSIEYKGDNGKGRIINHFHNEHLDLLTSYGLVGYLMLFSSFFLVIYRLKNNKLVFYYSTSVFSTLFFSSLANKTLSVVPLNLIYIIFFILFVIIAYDKVETIEK